MWWYGSAAHLVLRRFIHSAVPLFRGTLALSGAITSVRRTCDCQNSRLRPVIARPGTANCAVCGQRSRRGKVEALRNGAMKVRSHHAIGR
eukprot:769109-Prymnesium_polylepis.3